MLEDILIKYGGQEVTAMDVYSAMFRLGRGYIQRSGEYSKDFKGNPLGYFKNKEEDTGHYRVMLDDTFEDNLKEMQEADFAILNGIAYLGRKNTQARATKLYALIFDIDGVTDVTLNNFMYAARQEERRVLPMPNYVALSGHNIHLYYIFDEPINLYPYLKFQLKEAKHALTKRLWNEKTSIEKKIQYQGLNQGFRPIGGKTKLDGIRVRAFKTRDKYYTLVELCEYIPEEARVDQQQLFKETKYTLEEAKKKFPEWYQNTIVDKKRSYWNLSEKVNGKDPFAIYHWWLERIKTEAEYHHRYFNIMMLTIYAIKCRYPYERLKEDALSLVDLFDGIYPDDPFTEADVMSALECYDLRYCTFPIKDIEKLSGLDIKKNKRNYRKRQEHIKIITFIRDEIAGKKDTWRNTNGAPIKADIVKEWREQHADGSRAACARETGLSRNTVSKWWKVKE